ncbi:hypothetical protein P3L10_012925 [Capsicum annuum]
MAGKHPVLFFLRYTNTVDEVPKKSLIGFKSVNLKAGENTQTTFDVKPCEHFTRANNYGSLVIDEGNISCSWEMRSILLLCLYDLPYLSCKLELSCQLVKLNYHRR